MQRKDAKKKRERMRDDLVETLREEVRRNLGCRAAAKSVIHHSRGWYYVNIAQRFGDGSVGAIGEATAMRETEFISLILRHRQRAREKNQGAAIRSFDALRRRLADLERQQARAQEADDPQGGCAAYHRGARHIINIILAEVTPQATTKRRTKRKG